MQPCRHGALAWSSARRRREPRTTQTGGELRLLFEGGHLVTIFTLLPHGNRPSSLPTATDPVPTSTVPSRFTVLEPSKNQTGLITCTPPTPSLSSAPTTTMKSPLRLRRFPTPPPLLIPSPAFLKRVKHHLHQPREYLPILLLP